jgi:hypothetical protein
MVVIATAVDLKLFSHMAQYNGCPKNTYDLARTLQVDPALLCKLTWPST